MEFELDIQHRRQSSPENRLGFYEIYQYQGYRAWLHYHVSEKLQISLSPLMYVHGVPLSEDGWGFLREPEEEYRFSARLENSYEHRYFDLDHRYGFEFRYRTRYEDLSYFWHEYRTRYMLRFSRKITSNTSMEFYNEVFISFGRYIQYNIFSENRTYLGMRRNVGDNLQIELAYMFLLEKLRSGHNYNVVNVIYVALQFENLFHKRPVP